VHKLELRMTRPGLIGRARKSYLASPEPAPSAATAGSKPSAR
jgi:hypothetical protein